MSEVSNDPGRLSLDQILERLEKLESKSRTASRRSKSASSLPEPPIDLRDEPDPKPVAERHGPKRQPTLRTMAKEMAASAPASTTDAESTNVPERPAAAPPTVPKPPIGAAEVGRYGRSGSSPTPKVEKPSAKKINLTEFEERPKPVDIGAEPEDALVVQPVIESQDFNFKHLVLITFYVAIVLFALAAAIYFR